MIHYAITFAYGILLLGSFVGWGTILARLAGQRDVDASLRAAWGIFLCIVIGGVLNLLGIAFGWVELIVVAAGFLASIVSAMSNRRPARRFDLPREHCARGLLLAIGVVLALRYAAAVSSEFYNPQDDYQGYFVFPEKIVQTGQLGADAFSERRMISSLGGQYFLDSMLIAAVGPEHLNLLDRGIGLIVLAGLVWGLAREKKLSPTFTVCVMLPIALSRPPQVNVSSLLIASAAFVALFRTLQLIRLEKDGVWRDGVLAGVTIAGALALKNNIIPAIGLLALLHCIGRWNADRRGRPETAACAAVAAGSAILFILPWMMANLRFEGTLLYPLLGQGFHGSTYGKYILPTTGMNLVSVYHFVATAMVELTCVLALFAVIVAIARREMGRSENLACLAAFVASIVVAISIGGYATERFIFAFDFAAILIVLCYWLSGSATVPLAMLVIGLLVGENFQPLRAGVRSNTSALIRQIEGQTAADSWSPDQYRALQQSVPAGQMILARLDQPFLLDFRRNPIQIIDVPGRGSPPPGMPFFVGPEPIERYLLGQHIQYIAYSYADEAGFSRATMGHWLDPGEMDWIRNSAEYVFDFQDNLRALGETHRRVYDDGSMWVIDLSKTKP